MTDLPHRILVLGIGNPGRRYMNTYHNAGILFVDALKNQIAPDVQWTTRPTFSYVKHAGTIIARSRVFMNESGRAAADALSFLKYAPSDLVVAHDDADIRIGAAKISRGRGAAGHKGVLSVITALGTRDFRRARIGTRNPERAGHGHMKAGDFALQPLSPNARTAYQTVFHWLMLALIVNETPFGID